MTNRVSVGQPSITSIVSTLDTIPMVYNDIFSQLQSQESKTPIPKGFFQVSEFQCQFLLLIVGLKKSACIDHSHFLKLWQQSLEWGVENLFVEILARQQVNLSYPYSTLMVIGDFGAIILFYYTSLKNQWLLRYQFPINVERREVSGKECGVQICAQFYAQPLDNLKQWQGTLQDLLAQLRRPDFMSNMSSTKSSMSLYVSGCRFLWFSLFFSI